MKICPSCSAQTHDCVAICKCGYSLRDVLTDEYSGTFVHADRCMPSDDLYLKVASFLMIAAYIALGVGIIAAIFLFSEGAVWGAAVSLFTGLIHAALLYGVSQIMRVLYDIARKLDHQKD